MALLPSAGLTNPNDNNGQYTGGLLNTALNIVDPQNIRRQVSGLFEGGVSSLWNKLTHPSVDVVQGGYNPDPNNALQKDWRVRIGLPASSPILVNNSMLSTLFKPGRPSGLVFPYTPSITVTHNARYQEQALTHSNYKNYFYEGSDVAAINIVGDFTVQNHDDAMYLLASIYFLRTCTKMFWGKDNDAGNPPPIVYLDGYGDFYFPHVTCVVTSFQHTMPADVDYVSFKYSEVPGGGASDGMTSSASQQTARLPTNSQINVTLQPVYSRRNVAENMSLTEFSKGRLLSGKGGFL